MSKKSLILLVACLSIQSIALGQANTVVQPKVLCKAGVASVYRVEGGLMTMGSYRVIAMIDRSRNTETKVIEIEKLRENYELHKCEVIQMPAGSEQVILNSSVSETFEMLIPMIESGQFPIQNLEGMYQNAQAMITDTSTAK